MLLLEFAKNSTELRDTIIRNFIARSTVLLDSILKLSKSEDYQSGWALHRMLLERYATLVALGEQDSFAAFHDWSFLQQYKGRHGARTDARFKDSIDPDLFADGPGDKERYEELLGAGVEWQRPRTGDILRRKGLGFLYIYGYAFGSLHIHPMANDGQWDWERLTGLVESRALVAYDILLNNSCLVSLLLVRHGLMLSTLEWRVIVGRYLDEFRALLGPQEEFPHERIHRSEAAFYQIGKLFSEGTTLCRKKSAL